MKYLLRFILRKKEERFLIGKVPYPLLMLNFIVQRVFKNSCSFPCSVHYTTLATGYQGLKIIGKPDSIFFSFAVSGGCYIGIAGGSEVEIGEGTIWAFNFCIQTANHDLTDRSKLIIKNVKIGSNCWIGNSVTILPGVELGNNVTIGANTVVTKSFPDNVVIAGCPAKIIKHLAIT